MMFMVAFDNRLVSVAGTRRKAIRAAAEKMRPKSLAEWRVMRRSLSVTGRETGGFSGRIRLKIDEDKIRVVRQTS